MALLLRLFSAKPAVSSRPLRDTIAFVLEDGRRIDVLRVRDPRARRLKLSVDERGARLTLPLRASLVSGERFLFEHRNWLTLQFAKFKHDVEDELSPRQTLALPLRGADIPVRWAHGRAHRLLWHGTHLLFETPAQASQTATRRALRDFYIAQGNRDVDRWLPNLLPGLPRAPKRIVFKRMSSQWGSLSAGGLLALDLSLLLGRPSAFEYVLIHELCHLICGNHSRAFWREVERRFPTWRDERLYFHSEGRRLKSRLHALLS